MRYHHFIPPYWQKLKSLTRSGVGENVNYFNCFGKTIGHHLVNLKVYLSYNLTIQFLDVYPRETLARDK